ncbi:DUF899 domain-containing protein [Micromonospora fiedleri]|uniref:DUF899 domain-containing protein n=1 Tax=Micromonospora fiedleri TaxID=1157498 RepID=A0ABS1UNE5_9ACTN|nr:MULTISPECIES: DUF899 domain-containing protein [Micromonospora]MBL6277359.1 DUF899 domain-containing protein [Micromonospora fiedleri]WSK42216.1 DUF899 domain-containing protein [Micromonospora maris]
MGLPTVVDREEWLVARKALLATEAAANEARRAATAERQRLPMVRVDKKYVFEGPQGTVSLADMFEGRRQLIVYHMMFDPAWEEGCRFCSLLMDNVGHPAHLHARNTTFAIVSRAPLAKLLRHRERMGWPLPWYSSFDSDFNYDFHVTLDEAVAPVEYNYKDKATLLAEGMDFFTEGEQGAVSVFLRDGEDVFHTYSSYGWENDILHNTFNYLDLTPLGRQMEGPGSVAIRFHDRYPS